MFRPRETSGEGRAFLVEARSVEGRLPVDGSERRVARMVQRHGAALMRVARHFSLCQDDALTRIRVAGGIPAWVRLDCV